MPWQKKPQEINLLRKKTTLTICTDGKRRAKNDTSAFRQHLVENLQRLPQPFLVLLHPVGPPSAHVPHAAVDDHEVREVRVVLETGEQVVRVDPGDEDVLDVDAAAAVLPALLVVPAAVQLPVGELPVVRVGHFVLGLQATLGHQRSIFQQPDEVLVQGSHVRVAKQPDLFALQGVPRVDTGKHVARHVGETTELFTTARAAQGQVFLLAKAFCGLQKSVLLLSFNIQQL